MRIQIVHPDPASEFAFDPEGCGILECWNDVEDPQASIARARVAAGERTRWHALTGITERYLILEGRGLVEVGEKAPERVGPGDIVVIPAGVRQRVSNIGEVDLLFYAICTPRFRSSAYAALE